MSIRQILCVCLAVLALAGAAGVAADAKLKSPDDLKGQPLTAQRGTVGHMIAEEILGESSKKLLVTYERYADAVAALRQGKARAVIMDEGPANQFVKSVNGLAIMKQPLTEESYAIGIKKGNTQLVEQVNAALADLKSTGTLQAIIDKYMSGQKVSPKDIDLNKGAAGGKLVLGTEAGFAPYELKVGNGYIGIDIEMMAAIAKRLNKELVVQNINFDALPMALNSGKVDVIAAGITVTEDRKKNMEFSENYVEGARQVALVLAADLEEE